jgi:hypothetical protein
MTLRAIMNISSLKREHPLKYRGADEKQQNGYGGSAAPFSMVKTARRRTVGREWAQGKAARWRRLVYKGTPSHRFP